MCLLREEHHAVTAQGGMPLAVVLSTWVDSVAGTPGGAGIWVVVPAVRAPLAILPSCFHCCRMV